MVETVKQQIHEQIRIVQERIARAAQRVGRRPEEVRLIAVTKTHPVEFVVAAMEAGITDIGENRVQEAIAKFGALRLTPIAQQLKPRFHLIGHLQTNKAKLAVEWFDLIHSLDSIKLADELEKHAATHGRMCEVLIQVNVSGEETKFGIEPVQVRSLVEHILQECPHLVVRGFMTMAPFEAVAEATRPHFRKLRELRDSLLQQFCGCERFPAHELSMGMTNDYEVAIEEGATMVRIGSAIFGVRAAH
ncbi:MAG: YggS family pyridoxal phosphate-dependent enzyme [Candidatus Sumerlaea chitinivorans]|nr:YggS family pyridoxal phosphate-dependent enzyme [Candidatus Sumerlaea chitinivorans]